MTTAHLDVRHLRRRVDAERITRRMSWEEIAAQAGIHTGVLTRLLYALPPGPDDLAKLHAWLDGEQP